MAYSESTDFVYPLLADIYYPISEQGAYGNIKKTWILDKSAACYFSPAGRGSKQDLQPDELITIDNTIIGRFRQDITDSTRGSHNSISNIIITNIRRPDGFIIFSESGGPRSGLSTIYEIASFNPVVGPFSNFEYFKVLLKRSDNQAIDL